MLEALQMNSVSHVCATAMSMLADILRSKIASPGVED
jgi:hypothetical protein